MEYITTNEKETFELGIKIGEKLKRGDVIALDGDLGAGKTYLTKGIAKGLDIDEHITSPSFTILNQYDSGRLNLYHFDVYRINDIEEMYEIGFDEFLYGDGVSVIEWGSIVKDILPFERINIFIKKTDDDTRIIEITGDERFNRE
jgi:tRNA threonylcarbamoyladenosine biosynthesis protein TsaE